MPGKRMSPRAAAKASVTKADDLDEEWIDRWLDSVVDGRSTMSQRSLASVELRGGLRALRRRARAKGIHVVLLTDDQGRQLLAASRHPFTIVC